MHKPTMMQPIHAPTLTHGGINASMALRHAQAQAQVQQQMMAQAGGQQLYVPNRGFIQLVPGQPASLTNAGVHLVQMPGGGRSVISKLDVAGASHHQQPPQLDGAADWDEPPAPPPKAGKKKRDGTREIEIELVAGDESSPSCSRVSFRCRVPRGTVLPQVDGAGGVSDDEESDDELLDVEEETGAPKEDEEEEEEEAEAEDPADLVETEPLNSDDDEADGDEDAEGLFECDNTVVCQYDKVQRIKNKWKFILKDGVMNINSKDFIFSKANGDAEW